MTPATKRMPKKYIQEWLDHEGDRLLRLLQRPKARTSLERAFRATPKQMGRAAVQERKKQHRAQQQKKRSYASLALAAQKAASVQFKTLKRCFKKLEAIDPHVAAAVVETLESREDAIVWLGTSHRELAGHSPYQAIASDRRDEVLLILNAIEHGMPV